MQKYNFGFKVREDREFTINETLAKKLSETLIRIKGKSDLEISQSGDLDINSFINFRINRRFKNVPNLNIFNEQIEKHGLSVYLLIDCSGSMSWGSASDQLGDLTATIFKALKKCPFIDFKVLAFSGDINRYKALFQEIETLEDCKYITSDPDDRVTPTPIALNYIAEKLKKMENKKLVILFTDGKPETCSNTDKELEEQTKQEVINMINKKIEFFTIFYVNKKYFNYMGYDINKTIKYMRSLFKTGMYETSDFSEVEKIMIKKLSESVEKINQGA